MVNDCIHRNGFDCKKLNKRIAIDKRDSEGESCWEKMICDHFECLSRITRRKEELDEELEEKEEKEEEPKKVIKRGQETLF